MAQAQYDYETSNGTVSITGYDCSSAGGAVTIPDTIDGLPVSSIEVGAFYGCTSLTSVTIPDSVTEIGYGAFGGCTSLTSITIGTGVTGIEGAGFSGCACVTGVYFKGNAPGDLGEYLFARADRAIVYYLPGTTGWGPTFGGRPTALWRPAVEINDSNFGVRTNQFGFTLNWAGDRVLVVEACTDLAHPLWSPVGEASEQGCVGALGVRRLSLFGPDMGQELIDQRRDHPA